MIIQMNTIGCSTIVCNKVLYNFYVIDEIMNIKIAFGTALKRIRKARALSQEDFSLVSSRTYISSLERGLKCPTLEKIELLAEMLEVHPMTLMLSTYLELEPDLTTDELVLMIKKELEETRAACFHSYR